MIGDTHGNSVSNKEYKQTMQFLMDIEVKLAHGEITLEQSIIMAKRFNNDD